VDVSFTTPKTWSFGEVLTSTDMNTYVRDNTAFLFDGLPAGIGSKVVQTVKTDGFTTTSATFTNITGMSATITPSTDTAKILVCVFLGSVSNSDGGRGAHTRIARGATAILEGNTAGSRVRTSMTGKIGDVTSDTVSGTIVFLDSPNSASAVTYNVQARRGDAGTYRLNTETVDSSQNASAASTITLIEVAA
jgi:hypothetical protein